MAPTVLIDAGAIVGALDRRDRHHSWAKSHFQSASESFLTCEAVVSEAFFVLEGVAGGKEALCRLIERGIVLLSSGVAEDINVILPLLLRYKDLPMSFADACMVRLAERHANAVVLTTDSDFHVYRKLGRLTIPTIMPP